MFEDKTSEKQIKLNAPTYMRPKRSVLDDPLDIDAGKQVVQQPAVRVPRKEEAFEPSKLVDETPLVETHTAVEVETVNDKAEGFEEVPVVVEAPLEAKEEATVSEVETGPESDPVNEPVQESEIETAPRRKGMTVFQQFIVLLLLLVVALFLATIYLYINGWIELPQVVLNIIEKGLALIP